MQFDPVENKEITTAAQELPADKAPGLDNIPAKIIKIVATTKPEIWVNLINNSLQDGIYPTIWKTSKLALIPKTTLTFRPICLLDFAGKVYKKILKARLISEIGAKLSKHR